MPFTPRVDQFGLMWEWLFQGHASSSPIIAVDPGDATKYRIYVLGDDCNMTPSLIAIDPSTGAPVEDAMQNAWIHNLTVAPVNATPAVDGTNTIYVAGSGGVEAVQDLGDSPSLKWLYQGAPNFCESPAISDLDGTIYVGQMVIAEDLLGFHAIWPSNGTQKAVHEHTISEPAATDYLSPAIYSSGGVDHIFVAASYRDSIPSGNNASWIEYLRSNDFSPNGCTQIGLELNTNKWYVGAPAISADHSKFYVAVKPNLVRCFSTAGGPAIWETVVPSVDDLFTVALGKAAGAEFVVVGSTTGWVTRLNVATGAIDWSVKRGSAPVGRSPSIDKGTPDGSDATICVINDAWLYFLRAFNGADQFPRVQASAYLSTAAIARECHIIPETKPAVFVLNSAGLHAYGYPQHCFAQGGEDCGYGYPYP